MKKSTYGILRKIPIIGIITKAVCSPVLFCSMGLDQGTYNDLIDYSRQHPDILITNKLANEIHRKKRS